MKYDPSTMQLQIGDIITAYDAGWWRVINIEKRYITQRDLLSKIYADAGYQIGDEYSPLIHHELICDAKGVTPKNKARRSSCDFSYCCKADLAEFDKETQELLDDLKSRRKRISDVIWG